MRRRGRRRRLDEAGVRALVDIVDADPGLYLDELQVELQRKTGEQHSRCTIYRCLIERGYTLQVLRRKAIQASRWERLLYKVAVATVDDPAMFIFCDESAVGENASRRRRGWGAKGCAPIHLEQFAGNDTMGRRYTLLGAADIDGFVGRACDVVFRKKKHL